MTGRVMTPVQTPHPALPTGPAEPTGRRPRGRLARAGVGLAVVAALVLSGCAQGPGHAAVVEGRVVTESEVQHTTRELGDVLPNPLARDAVLVGLIVGPYFVDGAARSGVGVSAEEARTLAARIAAGPEGEVDEAAMADLGSGSLDILRFSLASEALAGLPEGQEVIREIEEHILGADIDISPRYGEFDEFGQLVPAPRPWIETPQP